MKTCRIEVAAPAKINLSFGVGARRADGYHLTYSVMQAIDLMDKIKIETSEGNSGVFVFSNSETMPKDDTNLAVRAARLMLKSGLDIPCMLAGGTACSVAITIDKNIPMAAGLAGGSADAAAVIIGLASGAAICDARGSTASGGTGSGTIPPGRFPAICLDDLLKIGASIGVDVPFCIAAAAKANPHLGFAGEKLAASALWADGIGEQLSPLTQAPPKASVVLIKPQASVPTPLVYRLLDEEKGFIPRTEAAPMYTNDLEIATTKAFPIVADILSWLRSRFANGAFMMSGSGSACFAYIEENPSDSEWARAYAENIYEEAKKKFPEFSVILTETI